MNEVVVNNDYGGFSLSFQAICYIFDNMSQEEKYEMKKGFNKEDASHNWNIKDHIACQVNSLPRHHKLLVEAVKKFGEDAGGRYSKLIVVKISGNKYMIKEYDGWETVVQPEDIDWTFI